MNVSVETIQFLAGTIAGLSCGYAASASRALRLGVAVAVAGACALLLFERTGFGLEVELMQRVGDVLTFSPAFGIGALMGAVVGMDVGRQAARRRRETDE